AARLENLRRGVDHGRRGAPHRLQLRPQRRASGGLRRDGRHGVPADQQGYYGRRLQERATLERPVLSPGERALERAMCQIPLTTSASARSPSTSSWSSHWSINSSTPALTYAAICS